jgi:DNA-binding transcriptional LysR family regulator
VGSPWVRRSEIVATRANRGGAGDGSCRRPRVRIVHLEVRHLEILLAIQDCSSITGAARKLGVDQPHVTRQLQRIEQRLDSAVFLRTAKGVFPTGEGLRVLALARRVLAVMDEIAAPAVRTRDRRGREPLRILYHRLPAITILDELCLSFPGLQVRLDSTTPHAAHEQLTNGTADVFLGVWLPHVEWPQPGLLAAVQILVDPMLVHLAAGHRLAARSELELADLAAENWIAGVDPDSAASVSRECVLAGGFEPVLGYRVDDEATLASLVARGRGVALASSATTRRPAVVGRPYRRSSPARWMQVYDPSRVDHELVASIARLLRDRYDAGVPDRNDTSPPYPEDV